MSERSPDDRVGYGRPPLHTRFRKGRSGNPKGRPKGSRSLANIWSSVWNERLTVNENGQRHRITKQEAAIKQFANKAASRDKRLIEAMIKYHTIYFLGCADAALAAAGQQPSTARDR